VQLSPRTTVLFGQNGQGKTNFLEACYLLCTLRPLRAQKLAELVRLGSHEQARVTGTFELPGGVREVEVEVGGQGRAAGPYRAGWRKAGYRIHPSPVGGASAAWES